MRIFEPNPFSGKSMEYIWQHTNFPNFTFDDKLLLVPAQAFALQVSEVNGILQGLKSVEQEDFLLQILLAEAMKTSEIEGEYFSRIDVMSSLRQQLGLHNSLPKAKDKNANAIAQMMLQVRADYRQKLSERLLKKWHSILMAEARNIHAGKWRKGKEAMQVISGRAGAVEVHYEAPPSDAVPEMMRGFIQWYHQFAFLQLGKVGEGMLKAALAHLYFETIHPFEDGNGRIGRALAEKILAEHLELPLYIGLSPIIEKNKKQYYNELKAAQRNGNATQWILYFFDVMIQAEQAVKAIANFSMLKTSFFDRFKSQLNPRQEKAIQKMLEYGQDGFEGGMTAKKYSSINNTSKATATRDLQDLAAMEAFVPQGGGRSVSYRLNLDFK